jgi:ABC-type multidrug transport system ATPase subunit
LGVHPGAPEARVHVAHLPFDPVLPEVLRVWEWLAAAAAIRGDTATDAVSRLTKLGLQALADRRIGSLSRPEARAVALVEATTSAHVQVLLLEEPLVALDPRAAVHAPMVLRAKAREGCTVVVATSSPNDAGLLADDYAALRKGSLVGPEASIAALFGATNSSTRLRAVLHDAAAARALLGALARTTDVDALENNGCVVHADGPDPVALARAVAVAVVETRVDVAELGLIGQPPEKSPASKRNGGGDEEKGGGSAASARSGEGEDFS